MARWAEGVTILGDGPLLMERICGRPRLIQVSDDVESKGVVPCSLGDEGVAVGIVASLA